MIYLDEIADALAEAGGWSADDAFLYKPNPTNGVTKLQSYCATAATALTKFQEIALTDEVVEGLCRTHIQVCILGAGVENREQTIRALINALFDELKGGE